ncbi:UNKNOWN [Stylonychia lemnae]|uniref:Uncharacterized protein n=1 Tax=Stylonychia lemnae TaxID=5949 RepID=A0A078AN15_STYLE|nr:UNKNOWN [Stylonychia lemnae]|eukprot:CDW83549.1 UNKNOWN [Stylonychia lemnae]
MNAIPQYFQKTSIQKDKNFLALNNKLQRDLSKLILKDEWAFKDEQLIGLLEGYGSIEGGCVKKSKIIMERLDSNYKIDEVDKAIQLGSALTNLIQNHKTHNKILYYSLLSKCLDYIHQNKGEIHYPDQIVNLVNMVVQPEYKEITKIENQIDPIPVFREILMLQFRDDIHLVKQSEIIQMIINILKYRRNNKTDSEFLRDKLVHYTFDLNKNCSIFKNLHMIPVSIRQMFTLYYEISKFGSEKYHQRIDANNLSYMQSIFLIMMQDIGQAMKDKENDKLISKRKTFEKYDFVLIQDKQDKHFVKGLCNGIKKFPVPIYLQLKKGKLNNQVMQKLQKLLRSDPEVILDVDSNQFYEECVKITLNRLLYNMSDRSFNYPQQKIFSSRDSQLHSESQSDSDND